MNVLQKRIVCMGLILSLLMVFFIPMPTEATGQVSEQHSLSEGVQNIVRRSRQMTQIQWTPVQDITGWGGEVTYAAGETYTGLPYGQPVYASYVPWTTSLVSFLDVVNDSTSKMYTSSSDYNKVAPYYSIDSSAFVSWAWGLSSRQTNSTITNFATQIAASSYGDAQVGDCLYLEGSHMALITDITYNSLGAIDGIEISEAATDPATYYCCQVTRYGVNGTYSLSDLVSKYFDQGYMLYRCNTRDSVTYSHSCAVPLDDDENCSYCASSDHKLKRVGAKVAATGTVTLYSLPSTDAAQEGTVNTGSTIEIVGYMEDDNGTIWYKTVDKKWILASQTKFDSYLTTVSIIGKSFPEGDLRLGAEMALKGTITSRNPMISITASICVGDEVEQQISFGFEGVTSFVIDGSELDEEICFGELAEGAYTFNMVVIEEGSCPAGGSLQIKTLWSSSFVVGADECTHDYEKAQLADPSCEAPGVIRYTCMDCGHYYDELTSPQGHDYTVQNLPATCVDYEKTCYLCTRCEDSYARYSDGACTEWSETKPSDIEESLIETKTQYRYSDYETATSNEETISGWELLGSEWKQSGTGTVQYVKSWPSGFSTKHSLYTTYKQTPVSESENTTSKTTVSSDEVTGYLYYHWCRGTYTDGPINRKAKNTKQDDCVVFHAFFSTVAPSSMEVSDDGSVAYANADCCVDSHWYYSTTVNTQSYTTFENVFTHGHWTDWSDWSDTVYTESESRKVESRACYRYVNGSLGDHSWDNGTVTTEADCTNEGIKTYICNICSGEKTEATPALGHSFEGNSCTNCGTTDPNYAVPALVGKQFTLSCENEVLINFYYAPQNMDITAEDAGMLVFYQKPETVDITLADDVYEGAVVDPSNGYFMNQTKGIPAKEMGDSRYYAAYAKQEDGTYYYSSAYEYSPKKYCYNVLQKTAASEKHKALCVAMLNYGTAAQTYFDYKTDNLMNASLTQVQRNLVTAYSADLFAGAVSADSNKIGSFSRTAQGFSKRTVSVSLDGALAINYYFHPNAQINDAVTLYYWSSADYAAVQTMSIGNATGSVTMVQANDGSYWAQLSGIAAKKFDDTYYVAAVYDSGNETYCSGVIAYSLSKYCINHAKEGDAMQDLAAAIAMYGYYAKVYFTN